MSDRWNQFVEPTEATRRALLEIAQRYGTPTYAFDVRRAQAQVATLRRHLPKDIEVFYSLKANASLGVCDVFAACGLGADVASAGELATALEAGVSPERIFVAGPFKLPETIAQLRQLPEAVLSVDSASELHVLAEQGLRNRVVLRLRPDFGSCAVVPAGSDSRFGFTNDDLHRSAEFIRSRGIDVIGFHVFAGSQVLTAERVIGHLRGALELSLRAADTIGILPTLYNLGGGFGIPYAPDAAELDLSAIGTELAALVDRAAPARLALELGRFLVAQAGWYLVTVLGYQQHQGRLAVVVDGGTHQRADMCGLCLRSKARPPVALDAALDIVSDAPPLDHALARCATEGLYTPTDVLGCLSLPADVLAESAPLPRLKPGTVLAFANAGAYGIWSSPALFHASPLPAEIAFDGSSVQIMRERQPARSILEGQQHVSLDRFAGDDTFPLSIEERGGMRRVRGNGARPIVSTEH